MTPTATSQAYNEPPPDPSKPCRRYTLAPGQPVRFAQVRIPEGEQHWWWREELKLYVAKRA